MRKRKIKVLFVTHAQGMGGANHSMFQLMKELRDNNWAGVLRGHYAIGWYYGNLVRNYQRDEDRPLVIGLREQVATITSCFF